LDRDAAHVARARPARPLSATKTEMPLLTANPLDALLDLPAGPRLDVAIEQFIFGRRVIQCGDEGCMTAVAGGRPVPPRPFSTDIEAARLLMGQIEGGFIPVGGGAVDVVIDHHRYRASAPTVPLAICRAVLLWKKAIGD
jgi:hypothetical protein